MTGTDIINKITNLVGDTLDQDFLIQLINDEKNSIESELQLEITKKLDSTGSTTAGDTYTTQRSLPSDFYLPLNIYVGTRPVYPIPFEQQQYYQSDSDKYWIDVRGSKYYLGGTQGSAQTIYFYYQYATTDLTSGTLASWEPIWPDRFHSIIPYGIARKYFVIDQPEKARSWLPEHQMFYTELKRQMIDWDSRLKLNAIGYSATPISGVSDSENRVNI